MLAAHHFCPLVSLCHEACRSSLYQNVLVARMKPAVRHAVLHNCRLPGTTPRGARLTAADNETR